MRVLLVLVACVASIYGKVTPDYFPSCKRNDPQINKCILDGIESMRPQLKNGIPEVNIPSIEPFVVPTLKLDRNVPNLRIKATIRQAKAFGASNFKIEKLKINLNNKYAAEVKISIPKLMVITEYDIQGSRLLTLDINGKGKLQGNFTGVTVIAKGAAKLIEKDGVEYLQAEKVITKVRINNAQVAVEDFDRPLVGSSTATFFNASPRIVLDVISPLLDETTAAIAKKYINKILGSIPIKEVLIDDEPAGGGVTMMIIDFLLLIYYEMTSVCHYSDPNVAQCIQRMAEQAKHLLAQGVPSFGIQPLEPLKVPNIRLRQHNPPKNAFKYDAWLSDVVLHGLTNFSFNKLDVYPEEMKVTANITLPKLDVSADYVILGKFQMLPVESTGKLSANFTMCTAALVALGARVHKRMVIKDADVRLRCGGALNGRLDEAHSTTTEMVGGFICPREEKALGRCLRDALNTYIPQLATGVPEYGVPSCEPLEIPALSVQQSTGPISVTSSYTEVTVKGPSSMRVKDIKVYSKKKMVVGKIYIPELRMKGNYALSGQLLMLPIKGDGKFTARYGDIDATVTIILGRQPRHNDVDALSCEDLDVNFHIGYASMKLENLFGGDEELGNTMNMFLNENWEKLAEELKGPMEEALRDFLKPLADHAFSTLNAEDILSD
ncbi:uncharacterized protein LOC131844548 [Achroia grisella]|uniref:uncharacterized protein LOC131844548 n=1 Tax=Achroia grisella TaxID=688607 RepID=UPI0027D29317|nr:uncharacterized protein LOC131844548 [Achroia grisella]